MVGRDVAADGPRLIGRLEEGGITYLQATPATWRLLLEAGWRGKPGLKIACTGEAMPRALAERLVDKGDVLLEPLRPDRDDRLVVGVAGRAGHRPDLHRPAHRQYALLILNQALEPVPSGVTGELYIGGAGLARGYRGRPGLTAERFVPDPFAREPGARLYRTGDLARWRPDGLLECLGRVDHQVKVRGYRVELGEIEAALAAHPAVRQAVVVTREYGPGDVRLVAYVTAAPDRPAPAAAELRQHLKGSLPDYMVPSAFVVLDALPLTPNGKVDRAALPAPERDRRGNEGTFVAPRGPIEERLAGIWSAVLGLDRVGVIRQLLRPGRPLAARHAGDVADPRRVRRRPAAARVVRQPDHRSGRAADRGAVAGRGRPRRPSAAPRRARGPGPGLVLPAIALVPGSTGARPGDLQHHHRRARPRSARSGSPRAQPSPR